MPYRTPIRLRQEYSPIRAIPGANSAHEQNGRAKFDISKVESFCDLPVKGGTVEQGVYEVEMFEIEVYQLGEKIRFWEDQVVALLW